MHKITFLNVKGKNKEEIGKFKEKAENTLLTTRNELELMLLPHNITLTISKLQDILEFTGIELQNYYLDDLDKLKDDIIDALDEQFYNYNLCLDYVEDNNGNYWGYQISWGGPSREVRFYEDNNFIEFVYLDWFEGVGFDVTNDEVFQELKNRLDEDFKIIKQKYYEEVK